MDNGESKTLILIDGHALAFRSFFALERTAMQTTEHQPTWAVYGFFKAIFDLLKDNKGQNIKPDAIAVAFDVSKKTFRLEKYDAYKANRQTMPDTLRSQMGLIMEGLKAFNIPMYTKEGFEGDDIIGTIAREAKEIGHKTLILTGDKDSFQLIDQEGEVCVLIPSKGQLSRFGWNEVFENLGVYPNQVVDYKALCGDNSDNIPGIKGIGPKTAIELLSKYDNLENIYEYVEEIQKNSLREKIINGKEDALLSQFLATIKTDVDIDFDFTKTCLDPPKKEEVAAFLQKLQFYSFVKNIDTLLKPFNYCPEEDEGGNEENIVIFKDDDETPSDNQSSGLQLGLFAQGHIKSKVEANEVSADELRAQIKEGDIISLFSASEDVYVAHNDSFAKFEKTDKIFSDPKIKKALYDYKSELNKFADLQGVVFDAMLASYVKDSSRKHDIVSQIQSYLNIVFQTDPTPTDIVICLLKLEKFYSDSLSEQEKKILSDIEIPLAYVLRDVEDTGVSLDTVYLSELGDYINGEILKYEKKIHGAAGTEFNISSPKQVQVVLFEKMQIKPKKKIKTGFSTNAKVLEELAQEYEIARDILEHRQLVKLKTTYVDSLPKLVHKDGRVHTHYNQTVTTTGRLSSSDPNLQNIPIRTELGARIRSAFVPEDRKNSVLLAADYSQIELRLLAHCSQDRALIKAFSTNEDIHTITAAKVFDVPIEAVTKHMRSTAKAVNFGLIYGQTRFGLSSALGISPFEAQSFIDKYFETYPNIRTYMNKTLMQAHQDGYVETILGRRRYLRDELDSRNSRIREFAERAAINAPLQGSSADLIKIAMVNLHKKLEDGSYKSKIILQVHDELVLEVPENELLEVKKLVCQEMECAQEICVPLKVDVEAGKTWKEDEKD